jgi:hypothetical protein
MLLPNVVLSGYKAALLLPLPPRHLDVDDKAMAKTRLPSEMSPSGFSLKMI